MQKKLNVPFYPNLSVDRDNNVRFNNFIPGVITGNTPESFKRGGMKIKSFADESMKKVL